MANLTNYIYCSEEILRKDAVETYYKYKTKFKHLIYDHQTDSFELRIKGKKYLFNYEVDSNSMLMFPVYRYYLKEQKYGTYLYCDSHYSKELDSFLRRYKKDRLKKCLPLRFLLTLLQIFVFKPVGWLKTKVGADEF